MPNEDFQREPIRAGSSLPGPSVARRDIDVRKPGGGVNVVIPYTNPSALIGYYLAVFSLIPCLALILGPMAFILGIFGLRHVARNPAARGTMHAWIGVLGGGGTSLVNAGVLFLLLASKTARQGLLDWIIGA